MFEAATGKAHYSRVVHHVALLLRVGADKTAFDDIENLFQRKTIAHKDELARVNQSPEAGSGGQGVASPGHSVDVSRFLAETKAEQLKPVRIWSMVNSTEVGGQEGRRCGHPMTWLFVSKEDSLFRRIVSFLPAVFFMIRRLSVHSFVCVCFREL